MIPWSFILTHGLTILKAADTLYSHATASGGKMQGIEQRVAALETQSLESARLLREIAQQLEALATAQQAVADRSRIALVMASVAAGAAISALIVAIVW